MPRAYSEIPETQLSVIRPVTYDVIRRLGMAMRFPASTEILYTGAMGEAMQPGAWSGYEGAPTKFPNGARLLVTVEESNDNSFTFSENPMMNNQRILFEDDCVGLTVRAIYTSTIMTFNIQIRAKDIVSAKKIHDEFQMRSSMDRFMMLYDLDYAYSFPQDQLDLMQDIYKLREAVAGYGDTFEAWLKENAKSMLTWVSDGAGGKELLTVQETQREIFGTFDFTGAPELPPKAEQDGQYTMTIVHRVRFNRPIGMGIQYPLVVHNQMIPSRYYGNPRVGGNGIFNPALNAPGAVDQVGSDLRTLFMQRYTKSNTVYGIRYPVYDDWLPRPGPPETTSLYSVMIQIDPNDPTDVLDLKALPGVTWNGDCYSYVAAQGPKLAMYGKAIVHVALYQGDSWLGDDALTVTDDLKVVATQPMSLRNRYHLRISLLNNMLNMNEDVLTALRSNGPACQQFLMALQVGMKDGNYVPVLVGPKKIVPREYFMQSAMRINRYRSRFTSMPKNDLMMKTVGYIFIFANRRSAEYASNDSKPAAFVPITADPNFESGVSECCDDNAAGANNTANT